MQPVVERHVISHVQIIRFIPLVDAALLILHIFVAFCRNKPPVLVMETQASPHLTHYNKAFLHLHYAQNTRAITSYILLN